MFTFEHIVFAALANINSPGLEIIFSRRFVRHIGSLIYFRSFASFFNNQSKPPLERIFRSFRQAMRSKERRLEGRDWRGFGSRDSCAVSCHFCFRCKPWTFHLLCRSRLCCCLHIAKKIGEFGGLLSKVSLEVTINILSVRMNIVLSCSTAH